METADQSPMMPVMLMVTTESLEQARTIARALLEGRLVACANLVPAIESHYWWKGTIEQSSETLLIAKTLAGKVDAARRVVRGIHTYEVFELIVLPIIAGSPEYLRWIADEVSGTSAGGEPD